MCISFASKSLNEDIIVLYEIELIKRKIGNPAPGVASFVAHSGGSGLGPWMGYVGVLRCPLRRWSPLWQHGHAPLLWGVSKPKVEIQLVEPFWWCVWLWVMAHLWFWVDSWGGQVGDGQALEKKLLAIFLSVEGWEKSYAENNPILKYQAVWINWKFVYQMVLRRRVGPPTGGVIARRQGERVAKRRDVHNSKQRTEDRLSRWHYSLA